MRFIVTGCAGFIGSNLCARLLDEGNDVIGIDSLVHNGKIENMDSFKHHPRFNFYPIAVSSMLLHCYLKTWSDFDPECVVHLAAVNSIQKSKDSPTFVMQGNVADSFSLFDLARILKWPRIVFASSSSVYGNRPTRKKTEGYEGQVQNLYATSKVFLENLAETFYRSYGLEYVGLRFFNVFGPNQMSEGPYAPVIAKWAKSGVCEIYGDGTAERDFTHVENVLDAIILAANSKDEALNTVYNIGCGKPTSLIELADMLGFHKDDIIFREARPGEVKSSYADLFTSNSLLGYTPKISLEEGLNKMGLWKSYNHSPR